jgi:hypothetical protein
VKRLGDVLDRSMTDVIESLVNLPANLLVYRARNAYTTWFRQLLYSCGQIDAIAIDVVSVAYYFTQVDTNPEHQALGFSQFLISRGHLPLKVDGGFNRRSDALELCKNRVTSLMNLPPTILGNDISKQVEASIEFSMCCLFIKSGQSTVASHVRVENGS